MPLTKTAHYFVRDLCEKRAERPYIPGKIPAKPRAPLVIFNYIPEYDWIVASASYLDEIYAQHRHGHIHCHRNCGPYFSLK